MERDVNSEYRRKKRRLEVSKGNGYVTGRNIAYVLQRDITSEKRMYIKRKVLLITDN
jgi:hypothetical protein